MDINTFMLPGAAGTSISTPSSGCSSGSWGHYLTDSVTLNPASAYSASVNTNDYSGNVQVFIDFNNNSTFESSETVGGMNHISRSPSLSTFTVTIPATAATGIHFMRVIVTDDYTYPSIVGCPVSGSMLYIGEAHDYTAVITGTVSACPPVTGLTAGSITSSTATVSWTASSGSMGYQYVVNLTASAPSGSGTSISTTSTGVTGLMPSTSYYAHVRDSCAPGNLSAWSTVPFTTLTTSTTSTSYDSDGVLHKISVQPNPAGDHTTLLISAETHDNLSISVFDNTGKIVKTLSINPPNTTMDLSGLSSGIYYIRYTDSQTNDIIRFTKK